MTLRLVGYLSLALLPLGSITILQSFTVIEGSRTEYRDNLVVQTARLARAERDALNRTLGLARGLVFVLPEVLDDPESCLRMMERTAEQDDRFVFVGFVGPDQISSCNSDGVLYDFSDTDWAKVGASAIEAEIFLGPSGQVSDDGVPTISLPVRVDGTGELIGFIAVSISITQAPGIAPPSAAEDIEALILFNGRGDVLTEPSELAVEAGVLPGAVRLEALPGSGQRVFSAKAANGKTKDYALVPIVDGKAYALGVWDRQSAWDSVVGQATRFMALPILMWLASLLVSIWAIRQLVILPIGLLRKRMRAFADRRAEFPPDGFAGAPLELQEIGAAFDSVSREVLRDEAELEDRLNEREVLLREVHHRVKNNLQLMSSIISMQIRERGDGSAEEALRRVQGRLASLAKFHQDLYETSSLSRLRADQLLEDLARQMVAMASEPARRIDLRLSLDPVVLEPDQASPVAMLVTEAMTNAIKYAAAPKGVPVYICLTMNQRAVEAETFVEITVENSLAAPIETGQTGLGGRLIKAFASQLGAHLEQFEEDDRFILRLSFSLSLGDEPDRASDM